MAPRTLRGAISDMYRIMMADTNPTPKPATRRPATMRPRLLDAVCSTTPMMKTRHPAMMVVRRPTKSAKSPAMIAPKKVPAERMEVMRDFCHDGRVKSLAAVAGGYGKPV